LSFIDILAQSETKTKSHNVIGLKLSLRVHSRHQINEGKQNKPTDEKKPRDCVVF